jgi:hypothetical protein
MPWSATVQRIVIPFGWLYGVVVLKNLSAMLINKAVYNQKISSRFTPLAVTNNGVPCIASGMRVVSPEGRIMKCTIIKIVPI